jgi:hypothetical protein
MAAEAAVPRDTAQWIITMSCGHSGLVRTLPGEEEPKVVGCYVSCWAVAGSGGCQAQREITAIRRGQEASQGG